MLRLPFLLHRRRDIEATFKTCIILHNMILRHDKFDTVGDFDDDWLDADLAMDDYRIGRDDLRCGGRTEVCTAASDFSSTGHAKSAGDDHAAENHPMYAVRKAKLLANFRYMWQSGRGLQWPHKARDVR
jgi:hypothetical protein